MNRDFSYLKEEYLELRKDCPKVIGSKAVYTAQMIFKLMEMAEKDVVPDKRFNVEEFSIWLDLVSLVEE